MTRRSGILSAALATALAVLASGCGLLLDTDPPAVDAGVDATTYDAAR